MIVTFCGHREVDNTLEVGNWLSQVIEDLIKKGAKIFYLGGYGKFDSLCKKVLMEYKIIYPDIQILLIVPYINHKLEIKGYDGTIYPEIENIPPRYAILKRNRWMVEKSDVVISYVINNYGGAFKTLEYSIQKGKNIISYKK